MPSAPFFTSLWRSAVVIGSYVALGVFRQDFYQSGIYVPLANPAIGVLSILLAWWGIRYWPALVVAAGVLHFLVLGDNGIPGMLFVAAGVAEVLFCVFFLCRGLEWSRGVRSVQHLSRAFYTGLTVPAIGAALGTWAIQVGVPEPLSSGQLSSIFGAWWLRSTVGFFVMAPVVGAWRNRPFRLLGPRSKEGACLLLVTLIASSFPFSNWFSSADIPLWFGVMPGVLVCFAAVRCGVFFTTHLALIVLALASFAALGEYGMFRFLPEGDLRDMWWIAFILCAFAGSAWAVLANRARVQSRRIGRARKRLELLIHDSPLALVEWDLDFRVRSWSRKAELVFGFSAHEAIDTNGLELLVPKEERASVEEKWLQVMSGADGIRMKNHNLTSSGKKILCDWYGSAVHDSLGKVIGVVCLAEDVSALESAALELRASNRRYHSVAEVVPQAIAYYSTDLSILYGNRVFREIHRLSTDQFPLAMEAIVNEAILDRVRPHIEDVRSGQMVRFLETIALADGAFHDLDRILLPDIGEDQEVRGFFSVTTDITEYRAADRERLALETQVLQTQKLESLGLLSGKIAHEFNNRLCGILGHADMARRDIDTSPERAVESLDKVVDIAREASGLCRQLFVYSGHGAGEKKTQAINPILQEMRRLLELTLPKSVRLMAHLENDLPDVDIDAAQMRQAIMNLVQNAAQAIGQGSGEVLLCSRKVQLKDCTFLETFLREDNAETALVEIMVRDSGEGMAAEELGRIFEPFFTRRPGARGLGLSGVLGIIHGHSGALCVDSTLGRGTEVKLYLPASSVRQTAAVNSLEQEVPSA